LALPLPHLSIRNAHRTSQFILRCLPRALWKWIQNPVFHILWPCILSGVRSLFQSTLQGALLFPLTYRCLESIGTGVCPLCRDRFHPRDTRRLHIDIDAQGTPDSLKAAASVESSTEARKLQDSIARIVKDGSSENHLRALIEECSTFLKTQNRSHVSILQTAICSRRLIRYLHSTRICGSAFA